MRAGRHQLRRGGRQPQSSGACAQSSGPGAPGILLCVQSVLLCAQGSGLCARSSEPCAQGPEPCGCKAFCLARKARSSARKPLNFAREAFCLVRKVRNFAARVRGFARKAFCLAREAAGLAAGGPVAGAGGPVGAAGPGGRAGGDRTARHGGVAAQHRRMEAARRAGRSGGGSHLPPALQAVPGRRGASGGSEVSGAACRVFPRRCQGFRTPVRADRGGRSLGARSAGSLPGSRGFSDTDPGVSPTGSPRRSQSRPARPCQEIPAVPRILPTCISAVRRCCPGAGCASVCAPAIGPGPIRQGV